MEISQRGVGVGVGVISKGKGHTRTYLYVYLHGKRSCKVMYGWGAMIQGHICRKVKGHIRSYMQEEGSYTVIYGHIRRRRLQKGNISS